MRKVLLLLQRCLRLTGSRGEAEAWGTAMRAAEGRQRARRAGASFGLVGSGITKKIIW